MLNRGEVIIVSGPPGAGKTTVAAAIAAETELGVHLESDRFYRAIRSGFVPPHLRAAHSQNTAVMDVVTDAAAAYADAGYTVVWDGVVGPWFLDRVAGRLAAKGVRLRYVVLRPDRNAALARVRERDDTLETSGAEIMYDQFSDLGEYESHVIPSNQSIGRVVEACRAALELPESEIGKDVWVDDRWSVSVKAILTWDGRVAVLKNRRGEWELPGGRLEVEDATPHEALRREIREELGIDAVVGPVVDSWIYDIDGKRVLILTYRCEADQPVGLGHSDEHIDVALLSLDELENQPIPRGYVRSIRTVLAEG